MAANLPSASGWLRVTGLLLLLSALLGWSAWWVVCNVYEFAPALASWPLLAAWAIAVMVVLRGSGRAMAPMLLAGLNGLCVLLQHRAWADGLGLLPLLVLMLAVLWWGRGR